MTNPEQRDGATARPKWACHVCGKMTNPAAGSPNYWPMELEFYGGNGKRRTYCKGCVIAAIAAVNDHSALVEKMARMRATLLRLNSVVKVAIESYRLDGTGKPPELGRPSIRKAWEKVAEAQNAAEAILGEGPVTPVRALGDGR